MGLSGRDDVVDVSPAIDGASRLIRRRSRRHSRLRGCEAGGWDGRLCHGGVSSVAVAGDTCRG